MTKTGTEMRDAIVEKGTASAVAQIAVLGGLVLVEYVCDAWRSKVDTVISTVQPVILAGAAYEFVWRIGRPVFEASELDAKHGEFTVEIARAEVAFGGIRNQSNYLPDEWAIRKNLVPPIAKALALEWPKLGPAEHAKAHQLLSESIAYTLDRVFQTVRMYKAEDTRMRDHHPLKAIESLHDTAVRVTSLSPLGIAYGLFTLDGRPIDLGTTRALSRDFQTPGQPTFALPAGGHSGVVWSSVGAILSRIHRVMPENASFYDELDTIARIESIGEIQLILVMPAGLSVIEVSEDGSRKLRKFFLADTVPLSDVVPKALTSEVA
jgi:hypothetical protein